MGLDITAYERVELIDPPEEDDESYYDREDLVKVYAYPSRKEISRPYLNGDWLRSIGDTYGFRAGSYSGYNAWRQDLCLRAHGVEPSVIWKNPEAWRGKAFVELIDFSDCEGTIGPDVCSKLAKDFCAHREKIVRGDEESADFDYRYSEWEKAFTLAAGSGVVSFH